MRLARRLPVAATVVATAIALGGCTANTTELPAPTGPLGSVTEIITLSAATPGIVDVEALGTPGSVKVTADGVTLGYISLAATGSTLTGSIESSIYGAQTICLGDVCGRVWVKDPAEQTVEEATAVATEALDFVSAEYGLAQMFPEWTFTVTGPLSGTGGTTDPEQKTITIYAASGRTFDDYVITVQHELGHLVDFEYLDDDAHATYLALRGLPSDTPWFRADGERPIGDERWNYAGEDFAEIVVALLTDGTHVPRDSALAPAPSPSELDSLRAWLADERAVTLMRR